MSKSSTEAAETTKSITKSDEKNLSKEFLPRSLSTQSNPIVPKQSGKKKSRNQSSKSVWSCLCCLFCCFMSCYLVCPPVPSIVTRKLAFNPPVRGRNYELDYESGCGQIIKIESAKKAFGKARLKISPKGSHFERKSKAVRNTETFIVKTRNNNHLVCLKFQPKSTRIRDLVIIFAQPNSCDLGELFSFNIVSEMLRVDICVFDYSGYGLSTGIASEANMYYDIQAVFDHICAADPITKVVLMGMSIGTAACVDLASKNNNRLAGMVLIAPFTSGCRLMRKEPGLRNSPVFDRFRSIDKICHVDLPVLLIHGLADKAIPVEHSEVLYQKLKQPVSPMFVPRATHNDVLEFPDVFYRIRLFIEQEI